MNTETELRSLCPKDEAVWVTYRNKQGELLFFLTSPARSTSTTAAQDGTFTLYAVIPGAKGTKKAKKLGQGGNPAELEAKFRIMDKMVE